MFTPAAGRDAALADVMSRQAAVLAALREVNKHLEWIDAELWRLTKIADGNEAVPPKSPPLPRFTDE